MLVASFVEVENSVHIAVVGDSQSWLTIIYCRRDSVGYARRTIEHGELCVGVEVDERSSHAKMSAWCRKWFYRRRVAP